MEIEMKKEKTYEERSIERAQELINLGYRKEGVLRELLICTTSKITCSMVMENFQENYSDNQLLELLFAIALEGDDSGDAPWAAANVISEFSGLMLTPFKGQLIELSNYEWVYLKEPALEALKKVNEQNT
jgi:hypothetical protein